MKKIFSIIFAVMMLFAVSVNAQTLGHKFTDNVSVGLQVGATTPLEMNPVFSLNPTANIFVQKMFTPGIGFRVDGGINMGTNWDNWQSILSETSIKDVFVGGDLVLNLSNIIKGYPGEPRFIELATVTGLGWQHGFGLNDYTSEDVCFKDWMYAKTGVDIMFNIGKAKAWQIVVEPQVMWNLTSNLTKRHITLPEFDSRLAQLGLTVGAVYKFKTSNGTHNFINARLYDQAEVDALNGQITNLKSELANATRTTQTIINVKKLVNPAVVYFAQGSAEITEAQRAVLDAIETTEAITVTGYASPEGTTDLNQALSEARAKAVADYLSNKGITVTTISGAGVAGETSNRVVVIR